MTLYIALAVLLIACHAGLRWISHTAERQQRQLNRKVYEHDRSKDWDWL